MEMGRICHRSCRYKVKAHQTLSLIVVIIYGSTLPIYLVLFGFLFRPLANAVRSSLLKNEEPHGCLSLGYPWIRSFTIFVSFIEASKLSFRCERMTDSLSVRLYKLDAL